MSGLLLETFWDDVLVRDRAVPQRSSEGRARGGTTGPPEGQRLLLLLFCGCGSVGFIHENTSWALFTMWGVKILPGAKAVAGGAVLITDTPTVVGIRTQMDPVFVSVSHLCCKV